MGTSLFSSCAVSRFLLCLTTNILVFDSMISGSGLNVLRKCYCVRNVQQNPLRNRLWKIYRVDAETKVIMWKTMFRDALEYGSGLWWPLPIAKAPTESNVSGSFVVVLQHHRG